MWITMARQISLLYMKMALQRSGRTWTTERNSSPSIPDGQPVLHLEARFGLRTLMATDMLTMLLCMGAVLSSGRVTRTTMERTAARRTGRLKPLSPLDQLVYHKTRPVSETLMAMERLVSFECSDRCTDILT